MGENAREQAEREGRQALHRSFTPEPDAFETDASGRTPKQAALRWFEYEHLRHPALKEISRQVAELAELMYIQLEPGPERSAGLRKLLEAKDCFVRQAVADRPELD